MNDRSIRKLTTAILAKQIETGKYGEISEERLRGALTVGPALTAKERSLLLLSPIAREDWNRVRRDVADELRETWETQHLELEMIPLSAAADSAEITFKGSGFSVVLFRQDLEGNSWVILVQLGISLRKSLYPMTRLRLVDGGGLEWMRGRPDVGGEMTALWEDPSENLAERAHRYSLRLEPI